MSLTQSQVNQPVKPSTQSVGSAVKPDLCFEYQQAIEPAVEWLHNTQNSTK